MFGKCCTLYSTLGNLASPNVSDFRLPLGKLESGGLLAKNIIDRWTFFLLEISDLNANILHSRRTSDAVGYQRVTSL